MDATDVLGDWCANLVSERRHEPSLRRLFAREAGQWVPAADLARPDGPPSDLSVTWLPAPGPDNGYAVVLFLDGESLWSTTAY